MPEIDRLVAQVEADTVRATASLKKLDMTADQAAESRTGVIKLIVDDDDLGDANGRRGILGGLFGGLMGGGGAGSTVFNITDGLGNVTDGLNTLTDAGNGAGKSMTGVTGSMGAMGPMLGQLGASAATAGIQMVVLGGVIATAAPAVVALGGAVVGLVAALSPLVGLLGVLPGLFAGLAGGAAVLFSAFNGIFDAIGEQSEAMENSEETIRANEAAVLSLSAAETHAARAARNYTNARRDAAEAIEDAQFAATSAQHSEERAILGLERAYKRLSDVQGGLIGKSKEITVETDYFTGKMYEVTRITVDATDSQESLAEAQLGVREAELSLLMAQDQREDSQRTLLDLQSRGIAQSDIVIDRTLALAQANQSVADAQFAVAEAQKAVLGQGEAYTKLTEEGQEFVDMIMELKPLWEEFQSLMQETLMPFATEALENLKPLLEELGTLLTPVAEAIGTIFTSVTEVVGSETFIDKLNEFFTDHAGHIETLGTAFGNLTMGLMDLTLAAKPLADMLVDEFLEFSEAFASWAAGDSEMGDLTGWFELTADVLGKVLDIIGHMVVGMTGFIEASAPFGGWLLDSVNSWMEDFSEFTNSVEGQNSIATFFESLKEPLSAISDLVGVVFRGFIDTFGSEDAMSFLTTTATVLKDDIVPAMYGIFDALISSGFMSELVTLIGNVTAAGSLLTGEDIKDNFEALADVLSLINAIFSAASGEEIQLDIDWENLVKESFMGLPPNWLVDIFWDQFASEDLKMKMSYAFEEAVDFINTQDWSFDGMWDAFVDGFEDALNLVVEGWNEAVGWIPLLGDKLEGKKFDFNNNDGNTGEFAQGRGGAGGASGAWGGDLSDWQGRWNITAPPIPGNEETRPATNINVHVQEPQATATEIASAIAWSVDGYVPLNSNKARVG